MASITQIKVTGSWRAQVRRKGFEKQTATFESKEQAVQWARAIEHKIDRREDPGANRQVLVAEVLRVYTLEREGAAALSDSQRGRANNLLKVLGKERAVTLNLGDLESFCRYRIDVDGVQPQSVVMDLNTLGVALRYYAAKRGTRLPVVVDRAAREHLRSLRLIAESPARSRRADARELKAILKHLPKEYHDVLLFAVASAMRRGEIASLKWSDVVERDRCVWVRARKHPDATIKEHNHSLVPCLGAAWTILKQQKRRAGSDLIFHFDKKAYSAAITAACKASGVENFRGHDLRHEGISRLFEAGLTIPQVQLISGHKAWEHLQRYTHLKPRDLHKLSTPSLKTVVA